MAEVEHQGDGEQFSKNWRSREESRYLHWCKGNPKNQIQLAFRNHWLTFSRILKAHGINGGSCLEVGCGRGSLSAYFADNGWNAHLLDISGDVIELAKAAFERMSLSAEFVVGNCLDMHANDGSYDCVFSIGLFEHFTNPHQAAVEQVRVLREGGILFAYIVPEKRSIVQEEHQWVNEILKAELGTQDNDCKEHVYRASDDLDYYLGVFQNAGLKLLGSSGIYSMPMISNSIEFPFTLLKPESEEKLVAYMNSFLGKRSSCKDAWLCEEDYGNAILIWGTK